MQSLDNAAAAPSPGTSDASPERAVGSRDVGGEILLIVPAACRFLVLRRAPAPPVAADDLVLPFDAAAVAARLTELAGDDPRLGAAAQTAMRYGVHDAGSDAARRALAELPLFLQAPGAPDPGGSAGHAEHTADILQRALARLLLVCAGADAARVERRDGKTLVDRACGFMAARIGDPLSLADVVRATDSSPRTLQYAFLARFGMSPMRWLREQRLRRLHAALVAAPAGCGVTGLAVGLGFTHLGRLGHLFKRRFGVLPRHLLRRTRGG